MLASKLFFNLQHKITAWTSWCNRYLTWTFLLINYFLLKESLTVQRYSVWLIQCRSTNEMHGIVYIANKDTAKKVQSKKFHFKHKNLCVRFQNISLLAHRDLRSLCIYHHWRKRCWRNMPPWTTSRFRGHVLYVGLQASENYRYW